MHYETHDDVIATWNRRKQRINFDNLIVIYASLKKEYIEEFLTLPYKNKICISPYDYEDECSYKVDLLGILREEWYSSTLGIFNYNFPLYDLLDMVCDNKKTYLGDITNKE